eukprot:TRINITY_DN39242_c0_g1_i1.p1 TRINITY_DN39242_c0_g1~~TRINITY_DN39242_c0_g1_i1.p1  ORF type:complete len:665 (-),score=137.33 TRINITY_DN39242_c0_g1_i1:53-2047(-)
MSLVTQMPTTSPIHVPATSSQQAWTATAAPRMPQAVVQMPPRQLQAGSAVASAPVAGHVAQSAAVPGAGSPMRLPQGGQIVGASCAAPSSRSSKPAASVASPSTSFAPQPQPAHGGGGSWHAAPSAQVPAVPATVSPATASQPCLVSAAAAAAAAYAFCGSPQSAVHMASASALPSAAAGDPSLLAKPQLLSARSGSGSSSVSLPARTPRPLGAGGAVAADQTAAAAVNGGSQEVPQGSTSGSVVTDDATVGALRAEIGGLRAELDALRGMLDEGLQQREEAERSKSTLASRVEQLSRRRMQADQQLREAHAETHWLRSELARVQRRARGDASESQDGDLRQEDFDSLPAETGGSAAGPSFAKQSSQQQTSSWSPPKGERQNGAPASPPRARNRGQSAAPQGMESSGAGSAGMSRSSSCRAGSAAGSTFQPQHPSASGTDEVDEMWRSVLQRFPQHPHWCLVKEKRCVYRMGSQTGKKLLCRVSHGGLQVRVGGGWMPALPFLERYGPTNMGSKPGEDPHFSHGAGTVVDLPPSMERLLVPTKSWAQRIGISKTPDLREQRRLPKEKFDQEEGLSETALGRPAENGRLKRGGGFSASTAPPDLLGQMAQAAAAAAAEAAANGDSAATVPSDRLQALLPLPWPGAPRQRAGQLPVGGQAAESGTL